VSRTPVASERRSKGGRSVRTGDLLDKRRRKRSFVVTLRTPLAGGLSQFPSVGNPGDINGRGVGLGRFGRPVGRNTLRALDRALLEETTGRRESGRGRVMRAEIEVSGIV